MVAQVEYSVAGRSRGRVTLCAIYTVHVETRSVSFLVEPQNQGRRFVNSLASKPLGRFSPILPQYRWRLVFQFRPQNQQLRFSDLGLKITTMVSWFETQNQIGFGLSVAPQNQRREDGVGHAPRSGGLCRLEASHARVSQSGLKTDESATAGGARDTITKVASGSS
jgi:hypothetical protein